MESDLMDSAQLTEREWQVVRLLVKGWSNKQIAQKLRITLRTVKYHTGNIYLKIRVSSRAEAIVRLWKHERQ